MHHDELLVDAEQAGQRLDHFLVAQLSRPVALADPAPDQGRPRPRRRPRGPAEPGRPGRRPCRPRRSRSRARRCRGREALPLDVLYEDADVIVVNKPAGMVVHPAPGHADGTLVNALLHHVDDLSGDRRRAAARASCTASIAAPRASWSSPSTTPRIGSWRGSSTTARSRRSTWRWSGASCTQGRRIDASIGRDPIRPSEDVRPGQARAGRGDADHEVANTCTACRTCTWRSPPAGRTRSACT